uniref:chloride channel protein n=1 Tax=uncultured Bilophila sp. TaxID=529385 RepID=UPI0025F823E8|nr:chloride channel protein [uncultured Bilophila sp.]
MPSPLDPEAAPLSLPVMAVRGLAVGLCAGGVVGLLRLSHDRAASRLALWLDGWREALWIVPLWFAVLVALALILRRIVRETPLISGSGIPQTELALAGRLSFTWWRVLLAKFMGSWLALFGGLALGREGPSIQMGGAVGAGFHAFWHPSQSEAKPCLAGSPYLTGGAVAGLAAAFGAPIAGVLFAFEEMKCRRTPPLIAASCAAALGAHVMVRAVFGMGRILPFADFPAPALSSYWIVALEGVVFGFLGVGYNRTLLWLHDTEARQTLVPDRWRALPPLVCAGIIALFVPQVIGGGEGLIISVGDHGVALGTLAMLLVLKYLFAQYSTVAAIPGGLLMPILCLGALWGRAWAELPVAALAAHGLSAPDAAQSYVLFGMAGYFAATVRAPLTGIMLVMEMSGAYACLPGSLLAGLVACRVANALRCPPVYDSLKARIRF